MKSIIKYKPILIFLIFLLFTPLASAATITCSIKSSCTSSETDFGGLAALNNSHYELYNESNYANRICCAVSGVTLDNNCSGSASNAVFIRAAASTNAHVELNNESTSSYFDVCMGADSGTLTVSNQNDGGACTGQDTCLMTVNQSTNSHVADCGANAFDISVCVSHAVAVAAVPEFSGFTFLLTLIIIIGGFFILKRRCEKWK